MGIKELKEEILKRYGRYLFGIVDIDVWYDRVEMVSRVEIRKGGRIHQHEGTIVVAIDRDVVDTKNVKECLYSIKLGSINYLKIKCDEFRKDTTGGSAGLVSRLYYIAIDDRDMGDKILDIMGNIHGLSECSKGFNEITFNEITFNVHVHNLL